MLLKNIINKIALKLHPLIKLHRENDPIHPFMILKQVLHIIRV